MEFQYIRGQSHIVLHKDSKSLKVYDAESNKLMDVEFTTKLNVKTDAGGITFTYNEYEKFLYIRQEGTIWRFE